MNPYIAYPIITILVIAVIVLAGLGWRKKLQFREIIEAEQDLLKNFIYLTDIKSNYHQFDYPDEDKLKEYLERHLGTNYSEKECWWGVESNMNRILDLVQEKHRNFLILGLKNPTNSFVRELSQSELRNVFDKIFLLNKSLHGDQRMSEENITQETGGYETVLAQIMSYQNQIALESIRKKITEVKGLVSDGKLDAGSIPPTTDPVLQQMLKEETAPQA